jgi:hypothetical protein
MRLEPLYRVGFTYPESWAVGLDGGWQQMFFLAEGRCEGAVTGRFRGANFPRKEGAAGPFRPDFRAVIETDDGAVIMVEWHGYGRAYPPERRQIVGSVFHLGSAVNRLPGPCSGLNVQVRNVGPVRNRGNA